MKRLLLVLVMLAVTSNLPGVALAAPLKVQVAEFVVTGAANKDELKGALQALLSSRLGSDGVLIVEGAAEAAAKVSGSYTTFGKTFSIDATVKNAAGELLGRSYVQGNGEDELIPAVGRLAEQLRSLMPMAKIPPSPESARAMVPVVPVVAPVVSPVPLPAATVAVTGAVGAPAEAAKTAPADLIPTPVVDTKAAVVVAPAGDIVRAAPAAQPVAQQTRIEGALLGIAPGRPQPAGRELVVVDAKRVYLYLQTANLKKVAEYPIKSEGKILALDTVDADGDGQLEVYVTIMDREELVSEALAITDQGFVPIAAKLPFYFRVVALNGKENRLYGQQAGRGNDDFYGEVCQMVKKGSIYTMGEPLKLPKYANIFSFNRFTDAVGKFRSLVIDVDGNLRVLDETGEELWRGSDRFGGSEVYFLRDEQQMQSVALDRYRWRFIEQRITVAPNGELIVPRNSGLLAVGNNRAYSKNSLYAFAWNGVALDERWHTKESANYLADYFYDAQRRELVILEQVQKEGLFGKGASSIAIKKVE
jgi:hypothetical protein